MNVTAAIVNYGTPELTRQAVWSLRSLYPELPIHVLDNASPDRSSDLLEALSDEVQLFRLTRSSRNLHHGPGLDLVIRASESRWILSFDSDSLAYRHGFLERMVELAESEDAYLVGHLLHVDVHGYPPESIDQQVYPYVHPHCALLRRSTYLELPPFEKHGAPCLTNQLAASERGERMVDFPVRDYVFHLGRGTVRMHGYRLGPRGWFHQLRHYVRRVLIRL